MKKLGKFLVIVFAVFVALGILGNLMTEDTAPVNEKPAKEVVASEEEVVASEEEVVASEEEVVAEEDSDEEAIEQAYPFISADQLIATFNENEVKANNMFAGQILDVEGEVSEISVVFGEVYVTLKSSDEWEFTQVQCFIPDDADMSIIESLSPGNIVIVRGEVEGKSFNVEMKNCEVKPAYN